MDFCITSETCGSAAILIWLIPLFVCLSTWFSYRSRRAWAYWPAASIIGVASVLFFLLFLNYLFIVISGLGGAILFTLIMGYASFSSFQRVRYHFSPLYRQGYTTFVPTPEADLEEGEMLRLSKLHGALAIRPDLLSVGFLPTLQESTREQRATTAWLGRRVSINSSMKASNTRHDGEPTQVASEPFFLVLGLFCVWLPEQFIQFLGDGIILFFCSVNGELCHPVAEYILRI